ncbi:MAG: hypothetical protein GXO43_04485 [Crenarchaeota archaeon]|nr:hypothetical protein [Thermoproteota archaeon]
MSSSNEEKCLELIMDINQKRRIGRLHSTLNAVLATILFFILVYFIVLFKDALAVAVFYMIFVIIVLIIKFSRPEREADLTVLMKKHCLAEDTPEELRRIAEKLIKEEIEYSTGEKHANENIYNK